MKIDLVSLAIGVVGTGTLAYVKGQSQDILSALSKRLFDWLRAKLKISSAPTVAMFLLIGLVAVPGASCQAATHKATLVWGASSTTGATYNVYHAASLTGAFTVLKANVAALTYVDDNLPANTDTGCYRITAIATGFSESDPTNTVCPGVTPKDQTGTPGALVITKQ